MTGSIYEGFAALFLVLIWLPSIPITAMTMSGKGQPALYGVLLGMFLGPLGWIVALLIPGDKEALMARRLREGLIKHCPECRSLIDPQARICPHCRSQLLP